MTPRDLPADGAPGTRRGFSTTAIHAASAQPVTQQPSSVPLYQTSTWRFDSLDEFADVIADTGHGYVYGRGYGNPTVDAFEDVMAQLAQTEAGFGFDSGMGAIHAVVTTLAESGQHIVASRDLYGGTFSLFDEVLPRYGITTRFVDPNDLEAVRAQLPGAQLFYVEAISNPLLKVADLPALAELCRELEVPSVIDSTFAPPSMWTPSAIGFDYVVHSTTKYIGGHSDLIGGLVCTSEERRQALRSRAIDTGGAMQPFEAWLCLRGIATLELRMERHCGTAMRLAALLASAEQSERTYYPGLVGDPSHEAAASLFSGFGGMVAFEHRGAMEGARRFCDALELIWVAASLGGAHSLVAHPASTTHRQVDPETRRASGLSDGLIRLSVGLEDPEDLLADVARALVESA